MQIKKEIKILCNAQIIYENLATFDFLNKINSSTGVNSTMIFENERVQKYSLNIAGVGEWESEKILIPETRMIIIHRVKPLLPFKYMVIIYRIEEKKKEGYCLLHYTEEFELEQEYKYLEKRITKNITEKDEDILIKIAESLNSYDW